MVDRPKKEHPYGITDEIIYEHRLTAEDARKFITDTYFEGETYLYGGVKGSHTRKVNRCLRVIDPAWRRIDAEGRLGIYEVRTAGGDYYTPSKLGVILAQDKSHANTIAKAMFAHVAGERRYSDEDCAIEALFLGGSQNTTKESLFSLNNCVMSEYRKAIEDVKEEISKKEKLIELFSERLIVIGSFDFDRALLEDD